MSRRAIVAALALVFIGTVPLIGADRFGHLPLSFEENRGQFDKRVDFLAHGRGYNVMLTGEGAILDLAPPRATEEQPGQVPLRIALDGADTGARAQALESLPGIANYYTLAGHEIKTLYEHVPTHSRIRYAGVYRGIDVVYYGDGRQLEYDFVVAPHADIRAIRLRFDGADHLTIDPSGDLLIDVHGTVVRQHKPVMYQELNGVRRRVASRYVRTGRNQVAFAAGRYDRRRPLTIDPVVVSWNTAVGGSADDYFTAVAVASDGTTLMTGQTKSSNFPLFPGGAVGAGDYAAIIVKLDAAGTNLVYTDYFNNAGYYNIGNDIKVDAAGDAYLTGQLQHMVLIARFGPTGTVKYAGILGTGSGDDSGNGIAVDGSGNVYLTGRATNTFPTTVGAYQTVCGGGLTGLDAFVAKVNTNVLPANSLVYSTFLGGASDDEGRRIAVDSSGNAYVTGTTGSVAFPTTATGYQKTYGGDISDVFVSKLSANGSTLLYSTFLGGNYFDKPYGLALDAFNNVVVGGYTRDNFPTTAGVAQPTWNLGNCSTTGGYDACPDGFIAKINPSAGTAAASLIWSTYLGGTDSDWVTALTLDSSGNVYVSGRTFSSNFPQVGAMSGYTTGKGFVAMLNSTATSISFSSFFSQVGDGLARQGSTGALFLAGGFNSVSAGQDGFVTKLSGLPADPIVVPFTDDPLVAGVTPVRAIHITELRTRIDAVRVRLGIGAYPSWTDGTLTTGSTPVRAVHITDLRTALGQAYTALHLTVPTWTDSLATSTVIKAVHISQLRSALVAIE